MAERPCFVGFDLGTSNSSAAIFDGETSTVVRNGQGSAVTPSVVRVSAKGIVTVGSRARRFLETDPENTRTGFKRLMGTGHTLAFPASGRSLRPAELAAEILGTLRADVESQLGFAPEAAAITVPALFEVPQSAATAEAGRLAGLGHVELVQEPVASALAAGWDHADSGRWLVFDLGGGTFDASLLEGDEGMLRVVGHDGDNFLGGRDIDDAVVGWILARLAETDGVSIRRDDPAHAGALRVLRSAAEEAKIELTRAPEAQVTLAHPLEVDGEEIDPDLVLDRATLERLTLPLVDRAIEVCLRLLDAEEADRESLSRVVLVGGPTVMPLLRTRVAERLAPLAGEGLDPMTLVAKGGAIFAASAGLDARPRVAAPEGGHRVLLQHPSLSTDPEPHVLGRLVAPGERGAPVSVRLVRDADGWESEPADVDAQGAFTLSASLLPRRSNAFRLRGVDAAGTEARLEPGGLTIVQGLSMDDPPLSRSIGVALANGRVHVYFERGAPLPAKRTFVHHTVEAVSPGDEASVLRVPVVQGEYDEARLCRLVGALDIPGSDLDQSVAPGSAVEVTLELDRGGNLTARAHVSALDRTFEEVGHLLVPNADPEVLAAELDTLEARLTDLRGRVFRDRLAELVPRLDALEQALSDARASTESARGGNEEAAQRARRRLLDVDAGAVEIEAELAWPEVEAEAVEEAGLAISWVGELGTPAEQMLLEQALAALQQERRRHSARGVGRQMKTIRRLGWTAYLREPESWVREFELAASRADRAIDPAAASRLVGTGRTLIADGRHAELRGVVRQLWGLMPPDAIVRTQSHSSGVR